MEADDARGTGRTALQMLAAPEDAVFVWCAHDTGYPHALAKFLSRDDLRIERRSWLGHRPNWLGRRFTAVVLDHELRRTLSVGESDAWAHLQAYIR
jgi:hypothetical protein